MHSAYARNLFTIIMLGCYQYIISNHYNTIDNNMSFESNYSKSEYTIYVFYTFFCASTISVNKSLYIPDTFKKKKN
jgi:hypothetical protein